MTVEELFAANRISLKSTAPGRYYTTCPRCSHTRTKAHTKCLGVTVGPDGASWGCNHCGWTGPESNGASRGNGHAHENVTTYNYVDEHGELLFQKVRGANKKFWQRRPDGAGGWINRLGDTRRVLYRLPEVIEAIAACYAVHVAEGEKDVDNLWRIGLPATCNPDGAAEPGKKAKWRPEFSELLRGADMVVMGDNDPAGRAHVEATASMSVGVATRVRVLDLAKHWPDIPKGGDISDWLTAGHTREELDALIERAADFEPDIKDDGAAGEGLPPKFSEEGIALAFTDKHADRVRYVAKWGQWLHWDGQVWRVDETLRMFDLARQACREAAASCRKRTVASAVASARTVAAVERLARSDRRVAAIVDQWDADPWLLNTPGGTIDLRTGKLSASKSTDYATKITTVTPQGDCPIWKAFISRITNRDAELAAFIQRMLGYALSGSIREHALFFLYGLGANGKSVLINTVGMVAGDYAMTAPIETFTASNVDRHPTELARLCGARIVTATETEEGRRWAEAKIKALTGGDKIAAHFMRQDFFEFSPVFKLVIAGNHKPGLRSVDEAIRRRFNLVPFAVTIPPSERDANLTQKLKAEWPGILKWMIEGCLAWQREGLAVPEVVRDATATYLESEDAIATWISDCCFRNPHASHTTSELFGSWETWAKRAGEPIGTMKRFSQNLEDRGLTKRKARDGRWFDGLQIVEAGHV